MVGPPPFITAAAVKVVPRSTPRWYPITASRFPAIHCTPVRACRFARILSSATRPGVQVGADDRRAG